MKKKIRLQLLIFLISCASNDYKQEKLPEKVIKTPETSPFSPMKNIEKESLSLGEMFLYSIENTERLAIRKEAINQAEAKRDNYFSNFFPTLSFRYQQFATLPNHAEHDRDIRNRNNLINTYSNINYDTNISTPYNASNYWNTGSSTSSTVTSPLVRPGSRLVLHIPIFTGLNEYSLYKSSKYEVKLRNLELKHDAGRIYLELGQAYYNLLQLESNLNSRKEILKLTQELKSELIRRVSLGRNKSSELIAVNSQISRLEAEILGVSDTYSQLKDTISYLTGLESNFKIQKESELYGLFSFEEIEKSIESRHDIEAAKINVEIAKAEVLKAYGGHLPTAAIDTFYTFPSGHISGGTKDLVNQFVVQVPIISLGTVTSSIRQAESLKHQMDLQLTQTIRFAREEIRKAYNSYTHSKSMEISYKTALESTENSYKAISRDYNRKSATEIDLLNAKISVINAKEDLVRTALQKELNLVWLKVATDEYPDSNAIEKINKIFSLNREKE